LHLVKSKFKICFDEYSLYFIMITCKGMKTFPFSWQYVQYTVSCEYLLFCGQVDPVAGGGAGEETAPQSALEETPTHLGPLSPHRYVKTVKNAQKFFSSCWRKK
jgi:hypothetical protein